MKDPDDMLMDETNNCNSNGDSAPPPPKKAKPSLETPPPSFLTGKEGVCRIEVARVEWIHTAPWQRTAEHKASGTGFCIAGKLLLTNAHVVKSAVDIRVRKHGSTRRWPARVAVYAPDVDLALLELKGNAEETQSFFRGSGNGAANDLALDFAPSLPSLQESIHVVGTGL